MVCSTLLSHMNVSHCRRCVLAILPLHKMAANHVQVSQCRHFSAMSNHVVRVSPIVFFNKVFSHVPAVPVVNPPPFSPTSPVAYPPPAPIPPPVTDPPPATNPPPASTFPSSSSPPPVASTPSVNPPPTSPSYSSLPAPQPGEPNPVSIASPSPYSDAPTTDTDHANTGDNSESPSTTHSEGGIETVIPVW